MQVAQRPHSIRVGGQASVETAVLAQTRANASDLVLTSSREDLPNIRNFTAERQTCVHRPTATGGSQGRSGFVACRIQTGGSEQASEQRVDRSGVGPSLHGSQQCLSRCPLQLCGGKPRPVRRSHPTNRLLARTPIFVLRQFANATKSITTKAWGILKNTT